MPSELDARGWDTVPTLKEIAVAILIEVSLGLGERTLCGTRSKLSLGSDVRSQDYH